MNYNGAKAGVIGTTKSLALELAKRRSAVSCVARGMIDTHTIDEETKERARPPVPVRRLGTTEAVAGLVSDLMPHLAGNTTRQVISIEGGLS